jgi:hypothetical protein
MRFSKVFWVSLWMAVVVVAPLWAEAQVKAQSGAPSAASAAAPAPSSSAAAPVVAPRAPAVKAPTAASSAAVPAGGAAPSTAGTAAGGAAEGPVDGSTFVVRMRDLEERVDLLKEQIRRSHTRLSLLSETVFTSGVGGARASVRFTNDLTSAFRLERVLFVLDGAVQYNKQDTTGKLAEEKTISVFSGSIPPGDHTLQVLVRLRGYGYGVFSYLRGYKFEVRSSHSFTVTEGKAVEINVVAWEKGGVTTPLEQRPSIRYVERLRNDAGGASSGTQPKSEAGASAGVSVGTGGE